MVNNKTTLERIIKKNLDKKYIDLPIKLKDYEKISKNTLVIFVIRRKI